MVKLYLQEDEHDPHSRGRVSWDRFCDHVYDQIDLAHPQIGQSPQSIQITVWREVRDQELLKWQAVLEHHPHAWSNENVNQYYLEFPDDDALVAFEMAWS